MQRKSHKRRAKAKGRSRAAPPPQTARLTIEMLGAGGDGIARADGAPVYVPYTVPGDEIEALVQGQRGQLKTLLKPGDNRVEPPCPYYGKCGGCALQHVSAPVYDAFKRDLIATALQREGFDADIIRDMIKCPPDSRRRAKFAVQKTAQGVIFGYSRQRAHVIEDIEACAILTPGFAQRLLDLRRFAAAAADYLPRFSLTVTLCDNGLDVAIEGSAGNVLSLDDVDGAAMMAISEAAQMAGLLRVSIGGEILVAFGDPVVRFGPLAVVPPPGGFLQASLEGEKALAALVLAHLGCARKVADLFCGAGSFTGPISEAAVVDGFDSDEGAIAALNQAIRHGDRAGRMTAHRRNLFSAPLQPAELNGYDAVVIDPPRAGGEAQMHALAQSQVETVVAVSCNPKSFARDAAILRAGGYVLEAVTPVDQFIYAAHLELAALFRRG